MSAVATKRWLCLSYTIRVAVNLEGEYGKSNQCASAASCGAARSAVARREVRPSDFRDRIAKWFRNIAERKTSNPNYLGSFTTENGEGAKGEMGEGSEGTPACNENNWPGSCKAHHFAGRTQEDRSSAKSAVGEAEGGAEESGVNTHKARCFGGGLFSLMRNHNDLDARSASSPCLNRRFLVSSFRPNRLMRFTQGSDRRAISPPDHAGSPAPHSNPSSCVVDPCAAAPHHRWLPVR